MTRKWDRRSGGLDRRGGIEGLPMELMIIVVVATIGVAILVGWMGSIEEPKTIGDVEVSKEYISIAKEDPLGPSLDELTITVLDNEGDPINGATVVLSGCSVQTSDSKGSVIGTTEDGKVTFHDIQVARTPGTHEISVHVHTDDYGDDDSAKILVVNE